MPRPGKHSRFTPRRRAAQPMAYTADGQPVATALLAHHEGLGYLSYAGTVHEFQGQGAQQALIAARVALARQLECTQIASDALSQLPHSLSNLEQLGFAPAHEKLGYALQA
jgi:GNAT superfamily N-acetyltransferase